MEEPAVGFGSLGRGAPVLCGNLVHQQPLGLREDEDLPIRDGMLAQRAEPFLVARLRVELEGLAQPLRIAEPVAEFVQDFVYEEEIGTGKSTLNHYNYETPHTDIKVDAQEGEVPCFTDFEHYEHTQNYVDNGEGQPLVDARKEESVAWAKMGRGSAHCRSFEAGYTMTLSEHFRDDMNCGWLLVTTDIFAEQGSYRCDFTAIPTEFTFRPRRKTPQPKVIGTQTAVVTGPSGSKVFLDEAGRCKLQFHWDREGDNKAFGLV